MQKQSYGVYTDTGEDERYMDMGVPFEIAENPVEMARLTQSFHDIAAKEGYQLSFSPTQDWKEEWDLDKALQAIQRAKGSPWEEDLPHYYRLKYPDRLVKSRPKGYIHPLTRAINGIQTSPAPPTLQKLAFLEGWNEVMGLVRNPASS